MVGWGGNFRGTSQGILRILILNQGLPLKQHQKMLDQGWLAAVFYVYFSTHSFFYELAEESLQTLWFLKEVQKKAYVILNNQNP